MGDGTCGHDENEAAQDGEPSAAKLVQTENDQLFMAFLFSLPLPRRVVLIELGPR